MNHSDFNTVVWNETGHWSQIIVAISIDFFSKKVIEYLQNQVIIQLV